MTSRRLISFWEYLKRRISEVMKLQNLISYGLGLIVFTVISFFIPYQEQVYLSIAAGLVTSILIAASIFLSRGFKWLDLIFIIGISFLFMALIQSNLPTRAVLENFRHLSLFLSVALTGLYVAVEIIQNTPARSQAKSIQSLGNFFSVCSTTLSSELCSCLHPTLLLEILGIVALLPNQIRIGFVIMMTTLVYQSRSTYQTYRLKIP